MKVKVLHILKSVGGVEIMVKNIIEHTDTKKVEYIIVHDDDKKKYFDKNNSRIKDYTLAINRELSILNDIKSIISLIRIIKQEKPDKIHCHSSKAGLIGRIAGFITKTQTLYTPHALSYLSSNNSIKKYLYTTVEKITKFQSTTTFLGTSKSEQDRGLKELCYKESRCLRFNNSIPPITLPETSIPDPNDIYLCTLSRPSYQKNIEMLIRAMKEINAQFPELKLKIIGAGYYAPNTLIVKQLISDFQLDDVVEIIEWCDKAKATEYIHKSKIIVSTSRYEGLPLSIIESLALSKACVVTNVDGNKDLIIDKYNGRLVPSEDYQFFAKIVCEVYQNSNVLLQYEKNSKTHFDKNFNIHNNIHLLENLYLS